MTVQAIVSEYNPFHNGHLYQLRTCARLTGATHTICVMSGHFVQRGEPAVFSREARTRMALMGGVDLVLELPAAFSCASAEAFAFGAVSTLDATGLVDVLCFGTEAGDLAPLQPLANLLSDEPTGFREALRQELDEGFSFAAARQRAIHHWLTSQAQDTVEPIPDATLLRHPNNILAVEYLKSLQKLNSRITPFTIARKGRGYNDPELKGMYPSATAIRIALANGITPGAGMPDSTLHIMEKETEMGRGPVFMDQFLPILLARLRTMSSTEMMALPWMEPGLDNRMRHAAEDADTFSQLVGRAASSRHPRTRIQRILTSILIGLTADLSERAAARGACYLRPIGFTDKGKDILARMRKTADLPLVGKASHWNRLPTALGRDILALECRAADVRALGCLAREDRKAGSEYRNRPLHLPHSSEDLWSEHKKQEH